MQKGLGEQTRTTTQQRAQHRGHAHGLAPLVPAAGYRPAASGPVSRRCVYCGRDGAGEAQQRTGRAGEAKGQADDGIVGPEVGGLGLSDPGKS